MSISIDQVLTFVGYSALGLAVALTFGVLIDAISRKKLAAISIGAVFVAFIVIVLADPGWRIFSYHGSMHISMVYELFERGAPPDMPLVAGASIKYFYAFHWIVAQVMRWVPIAPPWFFSLLNVGALVGLIAVTDRLAKLLWVDRGYRVLAISLVLIGFSTMVDGPIGKVLEELLGIRQVQMGIYHKFATINNNQLGILLFAITYLGFAHLVIGSRALLAFGLIGTGYLAIGVFYPPMLPSVGIVAAAALLQLVVIERPARWREAIGVIGLLATGAVLLLPWVLSVGGGKTGSGAIRLLSLTNIPGNALSLVQLLIIPALLLRFNHVVFRERFGEKWQLCQFLVLSACGLCLGFLFSVASHSLHLEDKILILSEIPLGMLLALSLFELRQKSRLVFVALIGLLALPIGYQLGPIVFLGFPVADEAYTSGRAVRHRDPARDELYSWLEQETPIDAIVIDRYLTSPVFSRRPLFVGVDYRRQAGELQGLEDGWGQTAKQMIDDTNGIDPAITAPRRELVGEILRETSDPIGADVLRQAQEQIGSRALFVIARLPDVRLRLAGAGDIAREVFSNEAATVFAIDVGEDSQEQVSLLRR